MKANLAHAYAVEKYGSVKNARQEFHGLCTEFAGDVADTIGGRLAYFELPNHPRWKYHATVEVDGWIHDLWSRKGPYPLRVFMRKIGADEVEYPAEE